MGRKAKDVKPAKSRARKSEKKISADSLPKILALARSHGSLQEQWVKCGKPNCRCSQGQLHGPYFYLFVSTADGISKSYVRRSDVSPIRTGIAERKRRHRLLRLQMRQANNFLRQMMKAALGVR